MWIDPDWYTPGFSKEKIPKFLVVLVAVALLAAISSTFSGCVSTYCPHCGHKLNTQKDK